MSCNDLINKSQAELEKLFYEFNESLEEIAEKFKCDITKVEELFARIAPTQAPRPKP